MTKSNDLTGQALMGYNSRDAWSGHLMCNPHLRSSNNWAAWHIGKWLRDTHRTAPRDVRASRGDTFHVNGMKVRIDYSKPFDPIERIA